MSVFKERLNKTAATAMSTVFLLVLTVAVASPLLAMANYSPVFLAMVIFAGVAVYTIYRLVVFINWLFIEPFRKKRSK